MKNDVPHQQDERLSSTLQSSNDIKLIQSDGLSAVLYKRAPFEYAIIAVAGSLLAMAAGFVNGCTVKGFTLWESKHRSFPTSHMTGTTTLAGLDIGLKDYENFSIRLCLIFSFIFGAFLVGAFSKAQSKPYEITAEYGPLFLILSGILGLACIDAYIDETSFLYYYFAAMAMGFQNAMTSRYSGSLIRTTHVTGTVTDIGLILGQYTRGVTKDLWKLPVLCSLLCSFFIGGIIAFFGEEGKLDLAIVSIFYFIVAVLVQLFISYTRRQRLVSALLGMWEIVHDAVPHDYLEVGAEVTIENPLHVQDEMRTAS